MLNLNFTKEFVLNFTRRLLLNFIRGAGSQLGKEVACQLPLLQELHEISWLTLKLNKNKYRSVQGKGKHRRTKDD